MAKRKTPKVSDLRRRPPVKEPKRIIYIICEGETEKDYFQKLSTIRNSILDIEVQSKGGAIRDLVNKVIKKEAQLRAHASKTKNSFDKLYSVWAVPDVDDHPKLEEAKGLAVQHNLNFALSNPCFELWGIFHYQPFNKPIDRFEAQKLLKGLMSTYCHKTNPYFEMSVLLTDYNHAIINAQNAFNNRIAEGDPYGTPSTKVYELVHLILHGKTKTQVDREAMKKTK